MDELKTLDLEFAVAATRNATATAAILMLFIALL